MYHCDSRSMSVTSNRQPNCAKFQVPWPKFEFQNWRDLKLAPCSNLAPSSRNWRQVRKWSYLASFRRYRTISSVRRCEVQNRSDFEIAPILNFTPFPTKMERSSKSAWSWLGTQFGTWDSWHHPTWKFRTIELGHGMISSRDIIHFLCFKKCVFPLDQNNI